MGSNLLLGVLLLCFGGLASATNFVPFRGIKRWSWEVYWIVQGFVAWIVVPSVLASILVPHLDAILRAVPPSILAQTFFWGALWGVGAFTFGLAIRYLGIALGYTLVLGLTTAVSTSSFLLFTQRSTLLHERSGYLVLAGVFGCLLAVLLSGAACLSKEREIAAIGKIQAGDTGFSFGKGILAALTAGVFDSFFVVGLASGASITALARTHLLADGRPALWQNLPVLLILLWGGFATTLIGSAVLLLRNRSFPQFGGIPGSNPMRSTATSGNTLSDFDPRTVGAIHKLAPATLLANYTFAALAGVLGYLQLFVYFIGQAKMGLYAVSSWEIQMTSVVSFALLWGLVLHEGQGSNRRTKGLIAVGFALLLTSIVLIGYGGFAQTIVTT